MTTRAGASFVWVTGLCLLGCATVPRAPQPSRAPAAIHARYRAQWTAEDGTTRRFRVELTVTPGGDRLALAIRGFVGGPVLQAAANAGRARLIFVRERQVIDGPDDASFWCRHIGLGISGRGLLAALLDLSKTVDTKSLPGWSVQRIHRVRRHFLPSRLTLRALGGARLELTQLAEQVADVAPEIPETPSGFALRTDDEAAGEQERCGGPEWLDLDR